MPDCPVRIGRKSLQGWQGLTPVKNSGMTRDSNWSSKKSFHKVSSKEQIRREVCDITPRPFAVVAIANAAFQGCYALTTVAQKTSSLRKTTRAWKTVTAPPPPLQMRVIASAIVRPLLKRPAQDEMQQKMKQGVRCPRKAWTPKVTSAQVKGSYGHRPKEEGAEDNPLLVGVQTEEIAHD